MQGRANVPFDRFKAYIEALRENKLVEVVVKDGHEEITLTDRALEYLAEYQRVKNFLVSFGLQEVKPRNRDSDYLTD